MSIFDIFKAGKAIKLATEAVEKAAIYEAKFKDIEAKIKFVISSPEVKELVEQLKTAIELAKALKK